jgi:serine/threonine protein phosphatase PrpC
MKNNSYIKKNTVTKYAFATRVGYIPMNPSKVNQDSYILSPCIESFKKNYRHMFGVCDGHG